MFFSAPGTAVIIFIGRSNCHNCISCLVVTEDYSKDPVRCYIGVTHGLMTGGRDDIGHTLVSKETWFNIWYGQWFLWELGLIFESYVTGSL